MAYDIQDDSTPRRLQLSFQENYASLSDDELLTIAASRADLIQEAALALDSEMARRRLSYQEARARKREIARLEIKELRRHRPSPKGTKYFVARMNGWMLLLLALGVPLLVISLIAFHLVREEWDLPILAVCIGAVIAISIVQPWLRQTVSFWLAVVVSCTVQLFVGHWISVHQSPHSRGALKGAAFLAIVFGYAVGAVLFLFLQKLKPKESPN
jgi:hypothetical protein